MAEGIGLVKEMLTDVTDNLLKSHLNSKMIVHVYPAALLRAVIQGSRNLHI